eukprot:TRINITY_DN938_c4_g1_i3.p1 TRINITY_DN938_c4_g1~~TRINITY_DN938_c4_g1_i3.p1  ORF type:complete len:455 (+),score=103.97 TRINITY_DN938_c4_g1_i3:111-1475(+)
MNLLFVFSVIVSCQFLGTASATCSDDDYTISIKDQPYFRIGRDDRTCSCETFVGQVRTTANASTLQEQVDQLKATVAALLSSGVGGGGNRNYSSVGLGSSCLADADCVYPFVCSPSSLRCLGSTGAGCTVDTQCAYGLQCLSGACSVAPSTCPTFTVDHGFVTYTNNGANGSVATVTCINGFMPVPTAAPQICQANGQWTGATTTCMNYNACALDANTCAPGFCTSTTGDYTCDCPAGWVGSGTKRCTMHNALTPTTWPGGTINGGAANPGYNNSNLVVCQYASNIDWRSCIRRATQYGGMLEPINVGSGWHSHRQMLPSPLAQYIGNQNDQTYRTSTIASSFPCLVCRDTRATRNDVQLSGFTTYDGQDWHYEDYGLLYYDECQLLAAQAGAMMITPATVGISSTVAYHINIIWPWDYAYFTWVAGNSSFGYEQRPKGSRSSVRACMVGYVDN